MAREFMFIRFDVSLLAVLIQSLFAVDFFTVCLKEDAKMFQSNRFVKCHCLFGLRFVHKSQRRRSKNDKDNFTESKTSYSRNPVINKSN